jgi:hypothetical protein
MSILMRLKYSEKTGYGVEKVFFFHAMSSIHTLNLADCTGLTSVDTLASTPVLATLDLADCTGLTSVDALVSASALTTLNLSYCYNLKEVELPQVKIIR